MSADASGRQIRTLEEAQEVIAQQSEELDQLRQEVAEAHLAEELRRAFGLAAAVNVLATPVPHARLLELIVDTAARVIGARAGSLFLVDREAAELIFEVAIGPEAEEVKKFRLPLGQGVAGLVAVTGQPMAISNVQEDSRHASDISQSIGYMPQNLLCVPLHYEGEVIGVFELLDREDGESFSPADIELLGHFANQAAVAIEQSETFRNLVPLIGRVLEELGLVPKEHQGALRERAEAFARSMEHARSFQQTLELAQLVQEIVAQGDAEYRACHQILRSFATYLRGQRVWSEPLGTTT